MYRMSVVKALYWTVSSSIFYNAYGGFIKFPLN